MAEAIKDWDVRSLSKQVYFPGKVHKLLPKARAARYAMKLVARYEAATPITDPLAIIWSDASCGQGDESTTGGISAVCDICLPGKPKYTIEDARYIESDRNIVLAEARAILKGCRRVKKEADDAGLRPGTRFAIIIVTDCQRNVRNLSRKKPMGDATGKKYLAVLEQIKTMSDSFLDLELDITLELYWCPRNATPKLERADLLAGEARKKRKISCEWECGDQVVGRVRDYINPYATSEVVEGLIFMPETAQGHIGEEEENKRQTRRRRKTPLGEVIEEEVEVSPEFASREHKRRRMRIEEPEDEYSNDDEAQNTVPVAEEPHVRPSNYAQAQPVDPDIIPGDDDAREGPANEVERKDDDIRQHRRTMKGHCEVV